MTEHARAADLSPEPRPAPALEDPGAGQQTPPPAHRLTVLASVLDRQQAHRTATETMREELEQFASLATLAPIWADVTRAHATRQYETKLRSLLPGGEWERYETDPERGTLARLLRSADLAGHDVEDVLRRAAEGRDFTGARSIAAVLHGRVRSIVGNAEPVAGASYLDRTPALADPEAGRLARDLATAMDERVAVLGNRAAADRPVWALRYFGEVPAGPIERADWIRRAGVAAAYREERGYAHETEAIGPAPERGSPEQRASWHAAYTALRMPEADCEIAAAADGELWTRRAAYARDTAWAPPYVADELCDAHLAEDAYRADAVLAWHRAAATDETQGAHAQQQAAEYSALAQEVGTYREALTKVADARRRWHEAAEPTRQQALAADAELRRRHPDADLPPLHPSDEPGHDEENTVPTRDEPTANQAEHDTRADHDRPQVRRDITAALAAAREAERILDERHQAERDSDEVMRRRETEALHEAEARRSAVRQDPAPSRTVSLELEEEAELEAGR